MTIDKGKFNLLEEIFLGLNLIVQSKKVKRYRID